jgi:hypothetical protein
MFDATRLRVRAQADEHCGSCYERAQLSARATPRLATA